MTVRDMATIEAELRARYPVQASLVWNGKQMVAATLDPASSPAAKAEYDAWIAESARNVQQAEQAVEDTNTATADKAGDEQVLATLVANTVADYKKLLDVAGFPTATFLTPGTTRLMLTRLYRANLRMVRAMHRAGLIDVTVDKNDA